MKRVLILHGWGGSDFPHWQAYLASELAKDYGCISFLKFSDIDFPRKDIWLKELQEEMAAFAPTVVVCHSIANTLWFHLCNEGGIEELDKLFLVAPPSFGCDIKELESFFPCPVPKKLYAKEALLITSTNDPYMSTDEANELKTALNIPMTVLQNAGHINTAGGYGEWQWIVKEIQR